MLSKIGAKKAAIHKDFQSSLTQCGSILDTTGIFYVFSLRLAKSPATGACVKTYLNKLWWKEIVIK